MYIGKSATKNTARPKQRPKTKTNKQTTNKKTNKQTSIYTYIHTYIHTCIHTHTYIHTYKHPYIHTYIHTYIHRVREVRRASASRDRTPGHRPLTALMAAAGRGETMADLGCGSLARGADQPAGLATDAEPAHTLHGEAHRQQWNVAPPQLELVKLLSRAMHMAATASLLSHALCPSCAAARYRRRARRAAAKQGGAPPASADASGAPACLSTYCFPHGGVPGVAAAGTYEAADDATEGAYASGDRG